MKAKTIVLLLGLGLLGLMFFGKKPSEKKAVFSPPITDYVVPAQATALFDVNRVQQQIQKQFQSLKKGLQKTTALTQYPVIRIKAVARKEESAVRRRIAPSPPPSLRPASGFISKEGFSGPRKWVKKMVRERKERLKRLFTPEHPLERIRKEKKIASTKKRVARFPSPRLQPGLIMF